MYAYLGSGSETALLYPTSMGLCFWALNAGSRIRSHRGLTTPSTSTLLGFCSQCTYIQSTRGFCILCLGCLSIISKAKQEELHYRPYLYRTLCQWEFWTETGVIMEGVEIYIYIYFSVYQRVQGAGLVASHPQPTRPTLSPFLPKGFSIGEVLTVGAWAPPKKVSNNASILSFCAFILYRKFRFRRMMGLWQDVRARLKTSSSRAIDHISDQDEPITTTACELLLLVS